MRNRKRRFDAYHDYQSFPYEKNDDKLSSAGTSIIFFVKIFTIEFVIFFPHFLKYLIHNNLLIYD